MPRDPASPPSSSLLGDPRVEWAFLHAGFVLIGISMTILGPVLPYFSKLWSLSDNQAGVFFFMQYFGSIVGTLLTSSMLPRFGFSRTIALGYLCYGLGFAFFGASPWLLTASFVLLYGVGYGLANPSINLRATQLPSSNVAAAVSLLNFSWGIGAVSSPFLLVFFQSHFSVRVLAWTICACYTVLFLAHLFNRQPVAAPVSSQPKRSFAVWMDTLRPAPWISLALLFTLYVGIEISVGGWVASDETRMVGASTAKMHPAPAFFYGFLLLGRALAPILLRYVSQLRLVLAGLGGTIMGVSIVAFAHDPTLLYVGAGLAGFGCAPQYPIYVTWLTEIFGENSTWIAALFFGAAGIGSSLIPWFVGAVAAKTHSLEVGFLLPLATAFLMIPFALRAAPKRKPA